MSSIVYLLITYFLAFTAGMAITSGKFRRNYLILLTVVVAIAGATMYLNLLFPKGNQALEGEGSESVQAKAEGAQAPFTPFYVYQDKNSKNNFVPSGFMPDSNCVSVDDAWQVDVKEGRSCLGIVYDVDCSRKGRKWAGLYWQNPANNWGAQKGGYNLKGATRLVFWARGHRGGDD